MSFSDPMVCALSFLGRVQMIEVLQVAAGVKPTCRLRLPRERLKSLADLAEQLGLRFAVGYDRITTTTVCGRGTYSEWCRRSELKPQRPGDCFVYLSSDVRTCERLRWFDERDDSSFRW